MTDRRPTADTGQSSNPGKPGKGTLCPFAPSLLPPAVAHRPADEVAGSPWGEFLKRLLGGQVVKTQQAAVGMWSTCKVVQHVHSLHRHALRLGGFLRLFVRSCTGWEWSTCKVVHDPLHRCIPGVWGGRAGGAPGQVADGPTKGRASVRRTPLLAAQPPGLSQFQQLARNTPNLGASPYLKPLALSLR